MKYTHQVLLERLSTKPASPSNDHSVLPVSCILNDVMNKNDGIESESLVVNTENLPEAIGSINEMDIKVFEDSMFTVKLDTPVRLPVGTPIFVQLSVDKSKLHGNERSKIIVEECFGIPFLGSSVIKYTVTRNQIAVEDGTNIMQSPFLHEVRFQMGIFMFLGNYDDVYLSCSAYVCPASDNSTRCNSRYANMQHMQNAGRVAEIDADELTAQPVIESPGTMPHNVILQPKLKRQPDYYPEELSGLFTDEHIGESFSIYNRKDSINLSKYLFY